MNQKPGNPSHPMSAWRRFVAALARRVIGTITGVTTRDNVIALTFDDGPNPAATPKLLEVLAKYDAHATFFMVGQAATENPDLVKKISDAGHAIGNHSWDHASFPFISWRQRRQQIRDCEKAIAPFGQKLFRPPFGHLNFWSRWVPFFLGYKVIAWDVTGVDWSGESDDQIVTNTESQLHPGAIVLLHDDLFQSTNNTFRDRTATITAVETLLQRHSKSTRFVTVPTLLRMGKPTKRNWRMMPDAAWLESKGAT